MSGYSVYEILRSWPHARWCPIVAPVFRLNCKFIRRSSAAAYFFSGLNSGSLQVSLFFVFWWLRLGLPASPREAASPDDRCWKHGFYKLYSHCGGMLFHSGGKAAAVADILPSCDRPGTAVHHFVKQTCTAVLFQSLFIEAAASK